MILLDTHIAAHWLTGSKRLSLNQIRAIEKAESRGEPIGISAVTLLELAMLFEVGKLDTRFSLSELLPPLESPPFRLVPLTAEVVLEVRALRMLKDPFDRTITATARVHGLRLVTSDQRIIDSNLVPTIE